MAESFGISPERYDRTRARYPDVVVRRVTAVSPGPNVLDVGCGTGIVARQFRAVGHTVLGVEPDARMARLARSTGIPVEVAAFETWDPAGRVFDAVVAGTAWHWIDPVAGAAAAARVLRPGGVLAPFGNVYQLPAAVADAVAAAYRRVAPDTPLAAARRPAGSILDAYQGLYVKAAEGIRAAGGFEEPVLWRYDWQHTYRHDELAELLATSGGLASLPPDESAEVLTAARAAIATLPAGVTLPYATWGLTATRDDQLA
jgi:SAM-dependent methyltransferase